MTSISRVLRHLFFDDWRLRKAFNRSALAAIEKAIGEQERRHRGELRFVIEAALPAPALWRNYLPRQRALDLFASLGVWDTEENSGVLIYVLLADKDVEIVADRGINSHVDPAKWE
ncbi:MAG TPA: TPM domain-containing protein, partial [Burkholderiales bacterium]|nr:TPM domain-containing protein [Burkholderiales bacterium]